MSEVGAIEAGPIGSDPAREDGSPEPLPAASIVDVLARLQLGADAGCRGNGAGPVNRLLSAVATAVIAEGGGVADREFGVALVTELVSRYLQAVRRHAVGELVPQAWQVLLDHWDPIVADPDRIVLAGAHAIVGHDLAPAVVSTCTLLGRNPGPVERGDVETIIALIADRLRTSAALTAPDDVRGLELLLSRNESWRQAVHLWTVRGRPAEAEVERAAMEWRAGVVAWGLLSDRPR